MLFCVSSRRFILHSQKIMNCHRAAHEESTSYTVTSHINALTRTACGNFSGQQLSPACSRPGRKTQTTRNVNLFLLDVKFSAVVCENLQAMSPCTCLMSLFLKLLLTRGLLSSANRSRGRFLEKQFFIFFGSKANTKRIDNNHKTYTSVNTELPSSRCAIK